MPTSTAATQGRPASAGGTSSERGDPIGVAAPLSRPPPLSRIPLWRPVMNRVRSSLIAALMLHVAASPLAAQQVDARGVPFRPWDAHAGVGLHFLDRLDGAATGPVDSYEDWQPSGAFTIDVGRYWTSHIKTEAGVSFLTLRDAGGQETLALASGQSAFAYWASDVRQTQLVVSSTYQFLDNAFAHPYIAGGARIGFLSTHSERQPFAYAYSGGIPGPISIPALSEDSTAIRVRPFLAFGSKAYFSERTFVRPEVAVAFNRRGLSQLGLRIGFGVDF
jgi:hypothetical protein